MSNAILSKSKFIHIPKCGGTAIQSALWRIGCIKDISQTYSTPEYPGFGHLFASQMPEDDRINFTFIRNPITWWHSFYQWNMKQKLSRFNGLELKTKSFDQWVDEYGQFWLGLYTRLVLRYAGEDPNFPTTNKVHHWGKTEHLFKDLKKILDLCEEQYDEEVLTALITNPYSLPATSINAQSYTKTVSDSTKDIIYRTEKPIFDRFGYSTEIYN